MACIQGIRLGKVQARILKRATKATLPLQAQWKCPQSYPDQHASFRTPTCRRYHSGTPGVDTAAHRVDVRSDTLTMPTDKMRQAMAEAAVGDDVFGEDPTVNELQENVAQLFGKEAALFVPTGTMANLICVMAACDERGTEMLTGHLAHMYLNAYTTVIGGVHPRTVANRPDGTVSLEQLSEYIRFGNDVHYPITRLICLENTHNVCGGKALPLDFMASVREIADERGLGVHLDGARLMNAAVSQGVPPARVLRDVDTVSMCFSKGLGAPVGSVVAGSDRFMEKARRIRKALGGGMRQVGILAAAALVGTNEAVERLTLDHQHAQQLAQAFNEHGKGMFEVDIAGVHTNIVMVKVTRSGLSAKQVCERLDTVTEEEFLATKDRVVVSTLPFAERLIRIVTNSNISQEDIQLAIKKIKYVSEEFAAPGSA